MSHFQIILAPAIGLMGLAFLFSAVLRAFHGSKYEQYAFGVLFGLTLVVGMTNPISLGDGVIFDTRTTLIAAAVAFSGPVAGLLTTGFGVVCRLIIGGTGTFAGVLGLLLAFGLALAWRQWAPERYKNTLLGDTLLGLFVTLSFVAIFVFPFAFAIQLVVEFLPVIVICNVIGVVAIGLVFRREVRYFLDAKVLATYANADPLTNLLNRRGFEAAFANSAFNPERGHALFYFDIDNFKSINDQFGHNAGDATLSIVADRIKTSIREDGAFARYGGDEFSIYVPGLEADDVNVIADRLCQMISTQTIKHKDQAFNTSVSMGAFWSNDMHALQYMIDRADEQLLLAKGNGKNRAEIAYHKASDLAAAA